MRGARTRVEGSRAQHHVRGAWWRVLMLRELLVDSWVCTSSLAPRHRSPSATSTGRAQAARQTRARAQALLRAITDLHSHHGGSTSSRRAAARSARGGAAAGAGAGRRRQQQRGACCRAWCRTHAVQPRRLHPRPQHAQPRAAAAGGASGNVRGSQGRPAPAPAAAGAASCSAAAVQVDALAQQRRGAALRQELADAPTRRQ